MSSAEYCVDQDQSPASNPVQLIFRRPFAPSLQRTGPDLTFARLCTSRHVADLQWIAFVIVLVVVVGLPLDIIFSRTSIFNTRLPVASAFFAIIVALCNWIYQSGSRRLGIVDLFACEISAICRVCLVIDFAQHSVEQADFDSDNAEPPGKFTSNEDYTPVYDNQLGDLQGLDVNVVTSVTEFYTYRKTMVDYLRATANAGTFAQRSALRAQMIYMQYLMYESGRHAIDALIEFQPNLAEAKVNILCSEMVAYAYLRKHFAGRYQGARLMLRSQEYHREVPRLWSRITRCKHPSGWDRAVASAPEMLRRYRLMCDQIGERAEV